MRIGLAYDLKSSFDAKPGHPEDIAEEYDSIETVQLIASSLEALGNQVIHLGGGTEFLRNILAGAGTDMVFNISEGRGNYPGREAQVPSVLEMCDIPYTGSPPQCLSVCLDKPLTKHLLKASGILTPGWMVINNRDGLERIDWESVTFPLVIKPAHEGSSIGIHDCSLVHDSREARSNCAACLAGYNQPVMLEEFISGEEVTVGVVGSVSPEVLGIMAIKPRYQTREFMYSIEVKRDYVNQVDYECPARLPKSVLEEISRTSLRIFALLGCRDMARIDFRIDSSGRPHFIEINPLPGLGNHSDLVIMAGLLGISHQSLLQKILSGALERYPQCIQI
ncbi:MAG: ATP-grasp domain-containing protein [Dehalococcoidales bacterium]